ncbi:stage II sporulation protein R [Haloimpatiens lingqiaonensis]|uniref:stage II sporulation protein R n=1 Tax=Haloimpatiens lingqiaonensis TaxID=1380675 RepID=UPI001FAA415A|nr:stage II sporulation protein R [Haloimpatiens lingqiaonensis]
MKKIIAILCVFILTFGFMGVKTEGIKQEEISNKLIRFHVIANSDEEVDQKLKLKVKDEVIKYIQPKLKNSKSIEESRNIIKENDENIIKLAKEIVKKHGYDYKVSSTFSRENFPVKTYGNITLPAGNYEAYRILIGKGEGRNWWCVMFPPLCFVDVTKGEVAYKDTEKEMKKVLSKEEYKSIDNTCNETIVLKFKILEFIKSLR